MPPLLQGLAFDIRFALRQARRSPGFAITVIGTLAVGIAAATSMFTVVDHVLLRPMPFRDSSRVVSIAESDHTGKPHWWAPWPDIEQWKAARSFSDLALFGSTGIEGRTYIRGNAGSFEVSGEAVSPNLFHVLGVSPWLGGGFTAQEPGLGANQNSGRVILSHAAWMAAFNGDAKAIGGTVYINGKPWTVAGVMPARFSFPLETSRFPQIWLPMELKPVNNARDWQAGGFDVVARLRDHVSLQAATAEMEAIQKRVGAQYSAADLNEFRRDVLGIHVDRYADTLVNADTRRDLLALLAAACALWLIAAVNVTNLMLARATARRREIALRGALGASGGRIVRQILAESLLLSGIAALVGVSLAAAIVRVFAVELQHTLPAPVPATPDWRVLAGLAVLTVISALVASLWPVLLAARAPIEQSLRQGGQQSGTSRTHHRMRGALVAIEIAMSLTLLVGCGLLLRTLYSLSRVPLGYRTDHIVVASLDIPSYRFTGRDLLQNLYKPLLERAQGLHGIRAAGLMNAVPLGKTFLVQLSIRQAGGKELPAFFKAMSPGMQRIFEFPVLSGRFFGPEDTPSSQPVALVNETFARRYLPAGQRPQSIVGMNLPLFDKRPLRVIGLLADNRQRRVADPAQPELDLDIDQLTPTSGTYTVLEGVAMDLAVRTSRPTSEIIPELRSVLHQASPELDGSNIVSMDQIVRDSYGDQRLAAHLLEIFGGSALLLCVAGVYGLLSYLVNQRTREIGVRIALGAGRGNIIWIIVRQAAAMLILGVSAGCCVAWAVSRLLRSYLYGVRAHDVVTLGASAVLLMLVGLIAAAIPARRAAAVNPMDVLRAE